MRYQVTGIRYQAVNEPGTCKRFQIVYRWLREAGRLAHPSLEREFDETSWSFDVHAGGDCNGLFWMGPIVAGIARTLDGAEGECLVCAAAVAGGGELHSVECDQ